MSIYIPFDINDTIYYVRPCEKEITAWVVLSINITLSGISCCMRNCDSGKHKTFTPADFKYRIFESKLEAETMLNEYIKKYY